MPQANSHSTWALASQGGYRWQFADCGGDVLQRAACGGGGGAQIQSLCVFMAGVRHKSSTLFQSEIARDRGPEALGAIHL